ncbi:MAG: hypothetical protein Q7U54_21125 [Bacteroidales bacterium]|nr:hypothetical protein [Bacteroidales bacterium]
MKNWLNRDKLSLGLLLGILIPVPVALIFAVLVRLIQVNLLILGETRLINMFLLGIAVNIVLMRYYILKLNFVSTAKGLILVSGILVLIFFLFLKNSNIALPF